MRVNDMFEKNYQSSSWQNKRKENSILWEELKARMFDIFL